MSTHILLDPPEHFDAAEYGSIHVIFDKIIPVSFDSSTADLTTFEFVEELAPKIDWINSQEEKIKSDVKNYFDQERSSFGLNADNFDHSDEEIKESIAVDSIQFKSLDHVELYFRSILFRGCLVWSNEI